MSLISKKPVENTAFPMGTYDIATKAHKRFTYIIGIGFALALTWSAITEIDQVTRGSGSVELSLKNQMVQHLEGGIVDEILVREGEEVNSNDVIMRIKDSFSKAEFAKTQRELLSQKAELQRLSAESEGYEKVNFTKNLEDEIPNVVSDERNLFRQRQASLNEQDLIFRDQYRKTILEKREKESRLVNMQREYDLVSERVDNMQRLRNSGAASKNELLTMQAMLQQIQTKLTDLKHQIPQIEYEISEIKRRRNDLDLQFKSDAEAKKIETQRSVKRLQQTLSAMSDRKNRTEVRAPIAGKIHRLFQTTQGGVIRSGQNLAQIVPLDAPVAINVRLSTKDRGKVWVGLPAVVKISAYDFSVYGGMKAQVTDISSDVIKEDDGREYYRVKLEAYDNSFSKKHPIVAGMAADVDIITGKSTILNYILNPINGISEKALREG